jgi:hypothetical protein
MRNLKRVNGYGYWCIRNPCDRQSELGKKGTNDHEYVKEECELTIRPVFSERLESLRNRFCGDASRLCLEVTSSVPSNGAAL